MPETLPGRHEQATRERAPWRHLATCLGACPCGSLLWLALQMCRQGKTSALWQRSWPSSTCRQLRMSPCGPEIFALLLSGAAGTERQRAADAGRGLNSLKQTVSKLDRKQVMNCINRLNVLDSQWLRDKARMEACRHLLVSRLPVTRRRYWCAGGVAGNSGKD